MPVRDDFVPGSPAAIREAAGGVQELHDDFDDAHDEMLSVARARDGSGWLGAAAIQFRMATEEVPPRLARMATAHGDVAGALRTYAARLEALQDEVDSALRARAEADRERAEEEQAAAGAARRAADVRRQLWQAEAACAAARVRAAASAVNPIDDPGTAARALADADRTVQSLTRALHDAEASQHAHEAARDRHRATIGRIDRQLDGWADERRVAERQCAQAIRAALPGDVRNPSRWQRFRDWVGDEIGRAVHFVADEAEHAVVSAIHLALDVKDVLVESAESIPFVGIIVADVADAFDENVAAVVRGAYRALDPHVADPHRSGDGGGTYSTRDNGYFAVLAGSRSARGRGAVVSALQDTADEGRIHTDEFELIDHGNGSYTIVLPGVTDLTNPVAGLDRIDRSVRDTDVVAARSAASTSVAGNQYAQMVQEFLRRHNVPEGSRLMIVGHSFGADTALDLASDPVFNGQRYHVTHVVAAAYASQAQLDHVRPGTNVLVLQNDKDVPVIAEQVGHLPTGPGGGNNAVVDRFDGGHAGAGHKQDNYIEHLRAGPNDPRVEKFFEGIDRAGYTNDGHSLAADVSVR